MIPMLFAMWAMAAPAGYVVGDIFAEANHMEDLPIKWVSAMLPFVAAVIALVLIMQVQSEGGEE